jgi:hypothetical protein
VLTVSDSEHEGLMGVPDVPDVAERVDERGRHCCGRGNHSRCVPTAFRKPYKDPGAFSMTKSPLVTA